MKPIFLLIISLFPFVSTFSQPTQVVRGQITDDITRQPIANATVTLLPEQSHLSVLTDMNGNYRFTAVPFGRQSLKITCVGYEEKLMQNIIVTSGKEAIVNIALVERIGKLTAVELYYDKQKDKKVVNNDFLVNSARTFNIDDTRLFAGSLGDPSRMAANFAGVIGANDSRNDIIIRGNSPTGLLWQLEGVAIPNPNHFGTLNTSGGPISLINSNVLDKSDFLTGAFPAQYGNALSGVFDLQMRTGNSENHELLAQLGLNGIEAGVEGPLRPSKKSKSSYLINYRYSTLAPFVKLGIDIGTGGIVPLYQDLNFKFHLNAGKKTFINLFGIGGISKANIPGTETDTSLSNFYGNENENSRINTKMSIGGISIEHTQHKTFFKLVMAASGTSQNTEIDSISSVTKEAFPSVVSLIEVAQYSAHFSVKHKISTRDNLAAGLLTNISRLQLNRKRFFGGIVNEQILLQDTNYNTLTQAYIQWKHRFNNRLTLITGIHSQYLDITNEIAVEPRMGLTYRIEPNQSISVSYGLHHSMQSPYLYFIRTPNLQMGFTETNRNLRFTRSHQLVMGYDWNFDKDWRLKTELYTQLLSRVPVERDSSSYSVLNTGTGFAPIEKDSLMNKGSGINYGAEITLERFLGEEGYYCLLTGSFFQSKYKGSDGVTRNTAFNNQYVVNLLAGKEWKIGKRGMLTTSFRLTGTGGRWLTPINVAASLRAQQAVYQEEKAFSDQQKPYFRADVKIGYRRELKKSTLELSVDFQNISNQKNIFIQEYNRRKNSIETRFQQGFLPVPTVRWTFL
jgi:hypothetical protein